MIGHGNKNIQSIFFRNKSIVKVYKGETLVYQAGNGGGGQAITSVFYLDQTQSDPTKMISGKLGKDCKPEENVVSWIRANSHRYVGTYNTLMGMTIRQLDDNDGTKYADNGEDASTDLTTKDVFMKMPEFWYRGEEIETDKYKIYFTIEEPTKGN